MDGQLLVKAKVSLKPFSKPKAAKEMASVESVGGPTICPPFKLSSVLT